MPCGADADTPNWTSNSHKCLFVRYIYVCVCISQLLTPLQHLVATPSTSFSCKSTYFDYWLQKRYSHILLSTFFFFFFFQLNFRLHHFIFITNDFFSEEITESFILFYHKKISSIGNIYVGITWVRKCFFKGLSFI